MARIPTCRHPSQGMASIVAWSLAQVGGPHCLLPLSHWGIPIKYSPELCDYLHTAELVQFGEIVTGYVDAYFVHEAFSGEFRDQCFHGQSETLFFR